MFANLLNTTVNVSDAVASAGFDIKIFLFIGIILVATKIGGIVCRKFGLPQVVGALLAGIIIGPVCLGLVSFTGPNDVNGKILEAMAQIGVLFIMFSAGLDTNLKEIKKNGIPSLVITTLGVVVPLIFGFLVGWGIDKGFAPLTSMDEILHVSFFGILLTATSVGITVEVLKELGKLKGKVGSSVLSAAILDDIIGIVILSVAISMKSGASGASDAPSIGMTLLSVVLFFVFAIVAGALIHLLFKWLSGHFPVTRRLSIFGLVMCFFFSFAAEHFFGVASITGAFVAGVVMSNMKGTHYVEKKVDTISYMLFGPIFFANIGLTMDFSTFDVNILGFTAAFVIFGLLSKIIGCGLGALMCKFSPKDSVRVGFGMMARGEVVLIVAQRGIAAGIIGSQYMFPVIILIIVSSFLTPIALKLLYSKDNASPLQMEGIEPPLYSEGGLV